MSSTGDESVPEERRRAVFRDLVETQDGGIAVADSRVRIAARYAVEVGQVLKIEREGMDNDWPPL
jgi:hypothetical protein